jgi:hypothetical protein
VPKRRRGALSATVATGRRVTRARAGGLAGECASGRGRSVRGSR